MDGKSPHSGQLDYVITIVAFELFVFGGLILLVYLAFGPYNLVSDFQGFWQFIFGLIIGVGTNLVAWWLLFHAVVPKIQFSPSISKLTNEEHPDDQSGYKYRVKIENAGRRAVIDLEIRARIVIHGLGRYKKSTSQWILMPLT